MTARGRDDRGSVVAEFAVALPAVALVLLFAIGAVSAGTTSVRLQDAAADAARVAARGEPERAGPVVQAAVAGASASVSAAGDLVCVTATSTLAVLALTVSARSCALAGGL